MFKIKISVDQTINLHFFCYSLSSGNSLFLKDKCDVIRTQPAVSLRTLTLHHFLSEQSDTRLKKLTTNIKYTRSDRWELRSLCVCNKVLIKFDWAADTQEPVTWCTAPLNAADDVSASVCLLCLSWAVLASDSEETSRGAATPPPTDTQLRRWAPRLHINQLLTVS